MLDVDELDPDAVAQLARWLVETMNAGESWATAMTLTTVSPDGRPSARAVRLKELDANGLIFFTNYASRKTRELAANPCAAVTFLWPLLERQARVEGTVRRLAPEESDAYFHTRTRGSQIGAWISPQSQPIEGRKWLRCCIRRRRCAVRRARRAAARLLRMIVDRYDPVRYPPLKQVGLSLARQTLLPPRQ